MTPIFETGQRRRKTASFAEITIGGGGRRLELPLVAEEEKGIESDISKGRLAGLERKRPSMIRYWVSRLGVPLSKIFHFLFLPFSLFGF